MKAIACSRRAARGYSWLGLLAGSALADSAEDIRDIRGPKAVPGSWVLPAVLAGAVVVALCVYTVWRRRHRVERRPDLTILEQALEGLEKARSLMRPATAREFGIAASEVIRNYIEKRFDVVATQRTTEEFLQALLQNSNEALARAISSNSRGPHWGLRTWNRFSKALAASCSRPASRPAHDSFPSTGVVLGVYGAAARDSLERQARTGRRRRIFRCESRARCCAPDSESDRRGGLVAADRRRGPHGRRVGPAAAHPQSH